MAHKIKTHLTYSPAIGTIEKGDEPHFVDSREKCPVCLTPINGADSEDVISTSIEVMGSEGAHRSCIEGRLQG